MLKVVPILGSARAIARVAGTAALLLVLAGCGQRGPLYLPTGPAGVSRASLPESLNPAATASEPSNTGMGTANPVPRQ
ncbi:MAG TPA: lipoprotein [Ramlibacter sp.]|jgi:predicted small lipoprotein YifL